MNKLEFTNKVIDNLNDCIHEDGKVGLSKFIELTNKLYEAINYTHCSTQLKGVNTDKINKLNDALKNIEEDEDFRLDDGMEWIKQKSFIEGKINALTNL